MDKLAKEIGRLERRPAWELKNMIKALSLHPWANTAEETLRLDAAKEVLKLKKRKTA